MTGLRLRPVPTIYRSRSLRVSYFLVEVVLFLSQGIPLENGDGNFSNVTTPFLIPMFVWCFSTFFVFYLICSTSHTHTHRIVTFYTSFSTFKGFPYNFLQKRTKSVTLRMQTFRIFRSHRCLILHMCRFIGGESTSMSTDCVMSGEIVREDQ